MSLTELRTGRREALALLAGLIAVPAVAGCQSAAGPTSTTAGTAPATPTDAGAAFPVTIDHALGRTTIASEPTRVVTVGYTDHEMFLALGTKPVGVRPWFGEKIDHTWPWVRPAWQGTTPTYIGGTELDFERIATLQPDLIVGLYAEITDDEYAKLSAIAPTVAQDAASAPYTTDRSTTFSTVGRILGKAATADTMLAEVDSRFAGVRRDHPEFAGKTAAVIDPSQRTFYAFSPTDPRGRFLQDLGFDTSARLTTAIGDKFGTAISAEQADLLDLDCLLVLADAENRRWLAKNRIYQRLPVVRDHRALEIPYYEKPYAGAAMAYNTMLSVPYAVRHLTPGLASLTG